MTSVSGTACLRAFRSQSAITLDFRRRIQHIATRNFMTTRRLYADTPEPNASTKTSIPITAPEISRDGASTKPKEPLGRTAVAEFKRLTGRATETYTAYGVTEVLVNECVKQADYDIPQVADDETEIPETPDGEQLGVGSGWWYTDLGLRPTFSTWSQVTMLHMYMLSVRFRCFPADVSQTWQQHLLDHFFYSAEDRMAVLHNMQMRGTRNKYLKDLFVQWRGLLAAYDEGLAKGDAVLAAAVWRNLFKADENVDIKALATIVSYMRRVLRGLDLMPDNIVMTGQLGFGIPASEVELVSQRSKMLDLPLKEEIIVNEPAAVSS